jgi:hypothetical protein
LIARSIRGEEQKNMGEDEAIICEFEMPIVLRALRCLRVDETGIDFDETCVLHSAFGLEFTEVPT